MITTYAAADTYRDRETIQFRYDNRAPSTVQLDTAFVRGQRLQLEVRDANAMRARLWTDFAHSYAEVHDKPVVDDGARFEHALAGVAPDTHGMASLIPSLLTPERDFTASGYALRDATMVGRAAIDGHDCWIIAGRVRGPDEANIWIDRSTYVVRKYERTHYDDSYSATVTMTLDAHLDSSIDIATLPAPVFESTPAISVHDGDAPRDIATTNGDVAAPPPNVKIPASLGLLVQRTGAVTAVYPGTPAERAGIVVGERVVGMNGHRLQDAMRVYSEVMSARVGTKFELRVATAAGAERTLHITSTAAVPESPEYQIVTRPAEDNALVGTAAPSFDLAVVSGAGTAKLDRMRGSVVLLDFYASWCPPCVQQGDDLRELASEYPELRVIGISNESEDAIRRFAHSHDLGFTFARDDQDIVKSLYQGGSVVPFFVLIDSQGVIRQVNTGWGDHSAELLSVEVAKLHP